MRIGSIRIALCCALALLASCWFVADASATLPAFPGAEGAGALATGGRGGEVFHVTSLNDIGAGTLRDGIDNATLGVPRTIVFDVGGKITLASKLNLMKPNITIAGQTAPGNGIVITGDQLLISQNGPLIPNNTIVRYMRFRVATDPVSNSKDSFSINGGSNIMVDHVSASWGSDENLSITGKANNVTVQWSLISESLNGNNHGYGSLIAPETQGTRLTFHHNLYADNDGRTPRAGSRLFVTDFVFDYRNNVNYNWGTVGDWGGWGVVGGNPNEESLDENFINNYSIAGPQTSTTTTRNTAISSNFATSHFWQSGNLIDPNVNHTLDGSDTGWGMFRGTYTKMLSEFPIDPSKAVTTQSALDAYGSVMDSVGAIYPVRDPTDTRVIAGVKNQTGTIINNMTGVPGGTFPSGDYPTNARPAGYDTDRDGMPNTWELQMGLDPNNAADRNFVSPSGYTNLELFLNLIPGDFNADNQVDLGDFIKWCKGLGTIYTPGDYDVWRAHFGESIGGANGSGVGLGPVAAETVPEPATSMLVILAAAAGVTARRRRD
jgi:pectate lyase